MYLTHLQMSQTKHAGAGLVSQLGPGIILWNEQCHRTSPLGSAALGPRWRNKHLSYSHQGTDGTCTFSSSQRPNSPVLATLSNGCHFTSPRFSLRVVPCAGKDFLSCTVTELPLLPSHTQMESKALLLQFSPNPPHQTQLPQSVLLKPPH